MQALFKTPVGHQLEAQALVVPLVTVPQKGDEIGVLHTTEDTDHGLHVTSIKSAGLFKLDEGHDR